MLETEYLKLKYHNNVDSNTDEVDAEEYFNNNYKKIDANAKKVNEDLIKIKENLEKENTELSNNMPWNTVQGKSLHITDSAKYSKNRLEISGDMEQEKSVEGKNKCKTDFVNWESGDYRSVNGSKVTHTARIRLINLLKVRPNTTYCFNTFSDGYNFVVRGFDSAKAFTHSIGERKNGQTYTTLDTEHYLGISIFNPNSSTVTYEDYESLFNNSTIKPFICLDTEVNKTFEEYIPNKPSTEFPSMPVVCTGVQKIRQFGKNLLPNTATSKTINGITFTVNDDGTVTVNGTATATAVLDVNRQNLLLESGDYMLSGCPYGGSADTYKLDFIAKNTETNIVRYPNDLGQTKYIQVIEPEIITVTRIVVYAGVTLNNAIFKPMLERGKTATDYEAYAEEVNTLNLGTTQLCAIKDANGNVVAKDRPVYRNGKWQWEKIIKKRVLNGTENWTDDTVSTVKHFRGKLDNLTYSKTNNAYCDKFICRTSEAHGEWEYIYIIGKACFINIDNTKLTEVSLNGFKTWLSNNNVTVYYVLATPEYIDCTAEQSAVLDKLYNNFTLQKGTNNIIVESENGVGVNLELDYMQDLQTKLNLLEAMCVSNASQEV